MRIVVHDPVPFYMYSIMHASTSTSPPTTYSRPAQLTPALLELDRPGAAMLSKEPCALRSDSKTGCHPGWCCALTPSLILDNFVIWSKHKFSHLQVMLLQYRRALQSIIWPVYMSAHKPRILGLQLWTAPIQVQEPDRVCAIALRPATDACLVNSTCGPVQKSSWPC